MESDSKVVMIDGFGCGFASRGFEGRDIPPESCNARPDRLDSNLISPTPANCRWPARLAGMEGRTMRICALTFGAVGWILLSAATPALSNSVTVVSSKDNTLFE